jgi:hypothetical protein
VAIDAAHLLNCSTDSFDDFLWDASRGEIPDVRLAMEGLVEFHRGQAIQQIAIILGCAGGGIFFGRNVDFESTRMIIYIYYNMYIYILQYIYNIEYI